MKPEEMTKPSDVFKHLVETQIKLQRLVEEPREEVCDRCGEISEECLCEEFEL